MDFNKGNILFLHQTIFKIMTQKINTALPRILFGNIRYIVYKTMTMLTEKTSLYVYTLLKRTKGALLMQLIYTSCNV